MKFDKDNSGKMTFVDLSINFDRTPAIRPEVVGKKYMLDYATIDIETYVDYGELKPYAVGVFYKGDLKDFYRIDEYGMFREVFEHIHAKGRNV